MGAAMTWMIAWLFASEVPMDRGVVADFSYASNRSAHVADSTSSGMVIEFKHDNSGYAVVVDDNGRVAYAYLRDPEERIVSDVWLYNVAAAPEQPEWRDRTRSPPFLNPARYTRTTSLPRITNKDDVGVRWHTGDRVRASVYVAGQRYGIVEDGAKPGWSANAAIDGPLARTLDSAP